MTNPFGGGNAQSLYMPLSELEQEVLSRLVEEGAFTIHVREWGWVQRPHVSFGDARVRFDFRMTFDRPEVPQPCHYFDMELWARGRCIYRERQSTMYDNQPVMIAAGLTFQATWDIQLRAMDPAFVKEILPHATGLTSKLIDKDTKSLTEHGNWQMSAAQKALAEQISRGSRVAREVTHQRAVTATKKARG